jgi:acyl transferase domain-containing protein/acyl carrier protein
VAERDDDLLESGREIAVVGLSGRFPGARDLRAFWRNLAEGVEAITFPTDDELRAAGVDEIRLRAPNYVKAVSTLPGVEEFDAGFFGYSAHEAALLDPQQRLFLEHAWEALEDAGHTPGGFDGLIGVYAGVAWNTYLLSNLTTRLELFEGAGGFQVFIASDKDFMPTRVAYKLDLKGPALNVQTSCSTSLVAVHLACLSLQNFECDLALVGGVTVKVPQLEGYFHEEGGLASPDGHCRAFDARAAGTVFGSGVGVVALRRLADARQSGDRVRAVVKASAINNDGSSKVSYTAPSVAGQAQVVAAAQALAAVDPATIAYVETHGTGTALGDPIEVAALTQAFRAGTQERGFCALGSVKTNVGHLDAAAGVAGFIKTVLALEHGRIPPSLNFERPNPQIDFETSPFYVNTRLRDWPERAGPRRAAVSSFGVGGTNAHVILEQAPPRAAAGASRPFQPVLLSARSAEALEAATARLRAALDDPRTEGEPLADVAFTLACGRAVFRHRRAWIARDHEELRRALDAGPALEAQDGDDPREVPLAFLFPGEGAVRAALAHGLRAHAETLRGEIERGLDTLRARTGLDLRPWLESPGDDGASPELEQPALVLLEWALAQQWRAWGRVPRAVFGHGVGEYAAACVAGVLSLDDALALSAARGRACAGRPRLETLAVALGEEELAALLAPEVTVVALDAPDHSLVAGPQEALEALAAECAARGVAAHRAGSVPGAVDAAGEAAFRAELRRVRLQAPALPFASGVTGAWLRAEDAADPAHWVRHLRAPVRGEAGLRALLDDGQHLLLEVGPGRALSALAERHPRRGAQAVLASLGDAAPDAALVEACARLWLHGVRFDWRGFYADEQRARVPLPTYPFERRRYWLEARPRSSSTEQAANAQVERSDPSRWLHLPSWRRTAPPPLADPRGTLLVYADRAGLGETLVERWRARGGTAVVAAPEADGRGLGLRREGAAEDERFVLDPRRPEDQAALLRDLAGAGRAPSVIVYALALGLELPSDARAAFDTARAGAFDGLVALLRALSEFDTPLALRVLAERAVGLSPAEAVEPAVAPLLALVRTAAWELPQVEARLVDLALPAPDAPGAGAQAEALLDALARELPAADGAALAAWRGDERFVPAFEALPAPDDVPLRDRAVVLVTGGLSGDGFGVARALARRSRARLVLLDDSAQAGRAEDLARRVATLEALGAEVRVVEGAAHAPEALARALAEAESRFGALHGVVHAAQASAEHFPPLETASRAAFEAHFDAKARALHALDEALGERALDFVVAWSSLAGVVGGVGAGAFAAANLYLEAYARERRRRGGRAWRSLAFELWQADDVAPLTLAGDLARADAELRALALGPLEGEDAFLRALAVPAERVLVSSADLEARLAHVRSRAARRRARAAEHEAGASGPHPRPALPNPYVAPESDLERRIAEVWQRALGFAPVGAEDNFFELGGDSLLAVRVIARLKAELGLDLPVAQLYQGLNVRALARAAQQAEAQAEERTARLDEKRGQAARRREFLERRRGRRADAVTDDPAGGEEV